VIAVKSTQSLPGWLGVALSKSLLAFREVLIALLMGGLPVLIAYFWGGLPLLTDVISSYVPPSLILFSLVCFVLLFCLILWIERYVLPKSDTNRQVLIFIRSIFQEAGAGLIGVWRVLSGGLLAHLILWGFVEPETLTWAKAFGVLAYVASMLTESCVMSAFLDHAQRRFLRRYKSADEMITFDTSSTRLKGRNKKAL